MISTLEGHEGRVNAVAWAGIAIRDHEAGVVDNRFSSTLTFASEEDAKKAVTVIRQVIGDGDRRSPRS